MLSKARSAPEVPGAAGSGFQAGFPTGRAPGHRNDPSARVGLPPREPSSPQGRSPARPALAAGGPARLSHSSP